MWSQNKKKGKHYQIFNIKPGESKIKNLSNRIDKLTIALMMQLKLGHGFFKSYLVRLFTYDTKKCNGECNYTQDPEHLLIKCRWFQDEKSKLIKQMKPLPTTLQTLFGTNEGIKNLTEFLKITRVATRKWLLGNLEEEIQNDDFG